jgi:NAD(P)-dependent dehydrogenase (short-subunit alcohol dehydrogenase family)
MKKVLITGGTRGIGLEISKLFISEGYEVIILARDFSDFPQKLLKKSKQITFDLQEVNKIPQMVKKIGNIDILINNAGIINSLPYDNYPEDKKNMIIKINLEAPIALITQFSKGMVKRKYGRIVSVASIAGEIGNSDIWYGATKAGVINFTKSFARFLGEKGIVINCVAPGMVEGTNMFIALPQERKKAQLKRLLTHDFVQAESVAETVYWLASKSPNYINGNCIDINNGLLMR